MSGGSPRAKVFLYAGGAIRDIYGMRDVENIYRDQYGTARKFGSGCGIEEPYWESAKQALIYSLINKTNDRPKFKKGLLVKEINGTI